MDLAIKNLDSPIVANVVKGLNFILQKSYEANDSANSYYVNIDNYPLLLLSLGRLLDVVNPMGKLLFNNVSEDIYHKLYFGQLSKEEWQVILPKDISEEFKFLARYLDENTVLLNILAILRNISFEIANEIFLAAHTGILRHLISILLASLINSSSMECTQLAMDILINIGTKIDFTGQSRLQYNLYLDEVPKEESTSRHMFLLRMSWDMSQVSSKVYITAVRSLLPIIYELIGNETMINRYYLCRGLELLSKLSQSPSNEMFFKNSPVDFFDRLISLLCVGYTKIEPIVPENYLITGDPLGRSRPPFMPSLISNANFFIDNVDIEIRDLVIEVLSNIVKSESNIVKFIHVPYSIYLLYRIIHASVMSGQGLKSEIMIKVTQFLTALVSYPESEDYFRELRSEFTYLACVDDSITDLVCNRASHIFLKKKEEINDTSSNIMEPIA